jgi:hypothetical protein
VIKTLGITIIIESLVGARYSAYRKKPTLSILITCVIANLITQSLLWISLRFLFQHYLMTLFISEIIIWFIEGILLYAIRSNQLNFNESLVLSFIMNASSFGVGWLLPV